MNPIETIERYLLQQQTLYGNRLYLEKKAPMPNSVPEHNNVESKLSESDVGLSVAINWRDSGSLPELYANICQCQQCPLGSTRTNFVFGVGSPKADIMVIGEAPGADEDAKGEPFVGRAGQLLTNILAAIQLPRDDVFIANILKCRPPGNRRPETSETAQCEPFLHKQIELVKPKFILALGLTAANTLLKNSAKMGEMRGKLFEFHGAVMIVTYHPAALLRNPGWKKDTWEDVKLLRRLYDEYLTKRQPQ